MSTFSIFSRQKSRSRSCDTQVLAGYLGRIFSEQYFLELCKETGLLQRNRKCMPFTIFLLILDMCASCAGNFSIKSLYLHYIKKSKLENRINESSFFEQLQKKAWKEIFFHYLNKLMFIQNKIPFSYGKPATLHDYLFGYLGVSQIIAQDGTEIAVRPSCAKTMGASSKGRRNLDGTKARPSERMHLGNSSKGGISGAVLTPSAAKGAGEREHSLVHKNRRILTISDRGYQGSQYFSHASKNGNLFIIKGKGNSMARIISENTDDLNTDIYRHYNKRLNEIIPVEGEVFDFIVKFSNNLAYRAIKTMINGSIIILYTNIFDKVIDANTILVFYRIRWALSEISNKCLKSGNNLRAINSSKPEIVEMFFASSLCTYLLKNILVSMSVKISGKNFSFSQIKIHLHSWTFLRPVFESLSKGTRKILSQIKCFKEYYLDYFKRSKPSLRDVSLGKDINILADTIVANIQARSHCVGSYRA